MGTANTYAGTTLLNSGTLALTNASAFGSNTFDASGQGTLNFGTLTSTTSAACKEAPGTLTLNNATPAAVALTVGNNNGTTTYYGIVTGSGSVTAKDRHGPAESGRQQQLQWGHHDQGPRGRTGQRGGAGRRGADPQRRQPQPQRQQRHAPLTGRYGRHDYRYEGRWRHHDADGEPVGQQHLLRRACQWQQPGRVPGHERHRACWTWRVSTPIPAARPSAGARCNWGETALGSSSGSLTVNGGILDVHGTSGTQGAVALLTGSILNSSGSGMLTATSFNVQSGWITLHRRQIPQP